MDTISNKTIIQQVFDALGLNGEWTSLETIDSGCHYVLENQDLLKEKLPKRIVGDLTLLSSDVALTRRKSLLAFARRIATYLECGLIRKRTQIRVNKKTVSKYSYKLVRA